jgi:hypothetical protein
MISSWKLRRILRERVEALRGYVAPDTLQAVKISPSPAEYVHDHVSPVHYPPLGALIPLSAVRDGLTLKDLFYGVLKRLEVGGGVGGGENEKVRYGRILAKIQRQDFLGVLFFQGLYQRRYIFKVIKSLIHPYVVSFLYLSLYLSIRGCVRDHPMIYVIFRY